MTDTARQPVTIDANLYNQLVEALDPSGGLTTDVRDDLHARLKQALWADSCMDDGDGYGDCGTHNDRIEYWVDNFGPEGKVIRVGPWAPEGVDICFPVCPGAQQYRYDLSRIKVGTPASPS